MKNVRNVYWTVWTKKNGEWGASGNFRAWRKAERKAIDQRGYVTYKGVIVYKGWVD